MIRRPTMWFRGARPARRSWCGRRPISPRICSLITLSTTISPASSASSILT
ncbi:unnamed protein product [Linum tenue]|uniref:Uncharacterized protein n=1 Tax=Linum tenue TaxID=586396 RepID=A0AAV0L6F9_9ROSI|nr:unnamed protein product [Linum tenue]